MSGRGREQRGRKRDGGASGARRFDGEARGGKDFRGDRRRRGPDRRDRDFETDGRYREDTNATREDSAREKKPITLAKPDRVVEREKLEQEFPALQRPEPSPTTKEAKETPGVIVVKQREQQRSESPGTKNPPKIVNKKDAGDGQIPKLNQPIKLVDEAHAFCDGISEFVTENQDFTVIGVLGLQNTGKSSILNILCGKGEEDETFRVQTFEHQMLAEHCTNGVDVYITSRRQILLDCQPLLSASVMDRSIQLEKKFNVEFGTSENTIEVQSLQLIGYLFSICHVVVLVQDWFLDLSLIRLIQAAETLKPVTPTISGEDNQVSEYFPHLMLVHNKCEALDFEDDTVEEIKEMYCSLFSKSRLSWMEKEGHPNLVQIPDIEGERADALNHRLKPRIDYEKAGQILRQKIFSLTRKPLSQENLTERAWANLASKSWDGIKNSPFYMEYSRLLP